MLIITLDNVGSVSVFISKFLQLAQLMGVKFFGMLYIVKDLVRIKLRKTFFYLKTFWFRRQIYSSCCLTKVSDLRYTINALP